MKKIIVTLLTLITASLAMQATYTIRYNNEGTQTLHIWRADSRFGTYQEIGTTQTSEYTDTESSDSSYYQVRSESNQVLSLQSPEIDLFGENMLIFHTSDNLDSIAARVGKDANSLNGSGKTGQFSDNRYAYYFMPGKYWEERSIHVHRIEILKDSTERVIDKDSIYDAFNLFIGYYMHFGGLGKTPYDTHVQNIQALCPLSGSNVTCTFWRSAENLYVDKYTNENFWWAVSQAAPIRRMVSMRQTLFDYGKSASGGFAADCYFNLSASGWAQQQWYSRNCYYRNGTSGIGIPGWNHAFQGIEFGTAYLEKHHQDNWPQKSSSGWGFLSNEAYTPIIREKPFLYFDQDDSRFKVFVPALRDSCKGISYSETDMGEGESFDLLNEFYVAKPGVSAAEINSQLLNGKHIFFTPGIYYLEQPIHITRDSTIVMGTGLATLRPTDQNTTAIMLIDDLNYVTVASLLFDAGLSTQRLLKVGDAKTATSHDGEHTLLADLFFRIGGVVSTNTNADIAVEINSNDVITDHFWIWRADHGSGVGWKKNTSKNGLVVNGDHVTCYGLFNEHFQEYQTIWNGEYGRTFFYQCETPYDVSSQADYKSHDGTVDGWSGYKVADNVKNHYACMMGIYDVFTRVGGKVVIENSIEVPQTEGVHIHNACNYGISGGSGKGIRYVINGTVPSSINKQYKHYHVYDYCVTGVESISDEDNGKGAKVRLYPNPVDETLNVKTNGNQVEIRVFDLQGGLMAWAEGTQMNASSLQPGVYVVYVTVDGNTSIHKMIKK